MLDFPVLLMTYRPEAKLNSLGRSRKEVLLHLLDVSRYFAFLEPQMKTFSSSTHLCALLTWWDTLVFLEISLRLTIIKSAIGHPQDILLALSDDPLLSESAPRVLSNSWFNLLPHCSFYFQQHIVPIFLRELQYSILPCIQVSFFNILEEGSQMLYGVLKVFFFTS